MRSRFAAKFSVLLAMLGVFDARPVLASDRSCSPMLVEADADVRRRWPELADRIEKAFDGRDDIDACASVTLSMSDTTISVAVMLPDGRSAARSVTRREDVLPMVEALLLVPEREASVATFEPSRAPAESAAASPTLPAPAPPAKSLQRVIAGSRAAVADGGVSSRTPASSPDRLRVELSVGTGARIGDGQTSVGLGAFSFLDFDGWLAGFEGRLDRYQKIGGGSDAAALELAALGGRRLRLQTVSLDLHAGPAVVLQGTATEVTQTEPDGPSVSESSSSTVVRLLCGARLNFAARSTLRTFVGIDGEFGPERAPGADLPRDAPRLPLWTLGLAVGATVGTP